MNRRCRRRVERRSAQASSSSSRHVAAAAHAASGTSSDTYHRCTSSPMLAASRRRLREARSVRKIACPLLNVGELSLRYVAGCDEQRRVQRLILLEIGLELTSPDAVL